MFQDSLSLLAIQQTTAAVTVCVKGISAMPAMPDKRTDKKESDGKSFTFLLRLL